MSSAGLGALQSSMHSEYTAKTLVVVAARVVVVESETAVVLCTTAVQKTVVKEWAGEWDIAGVGRIAVQLSMDYECSVAQAEHLVRAISLGRENHRG
jgi:hypothetical protein